jgi:hypothetical protein
VENAPLGHWIRDHFVVSVSVQRKNGKDGAENGEDAVSDGKMTVKWRGKFAQELANFLYKGELRLSPIRIAGIEFTPTP